MNQQNKKILETIAWFDVFDWPLNLAELQKYAQLESSDEIPNDSLKSIENINGFYFLKGRQEIIRKRIFRQKIAIKKIKVGKFAAEILSFIPFVKMVAICNDLAYFNAPEESDIDFFIVVKSGKIWTARFFSTAALFFLGLWRHGKKIKNRICLSFFITDSNLNLEEIAYKNDIYLKYWILQIIPLFDRKDIYQKFLEKNFWATNEFPNFFPNIPSLKIKIREKKSQIIFEKILDNWFGNFLEKVLKKFQLKIMDLKKPARNASPASNASRSNAGWPARHADASHAGWHSDAGGDKNVIISDKILKFHENDRRKYFRNIFEKKLKEIY